MIQAITRYRLDGKEYSSLRDIRKYVENEIGCIIDSSELRLLPRDRLAVFNAIMKNHAHLRKLLSVEFSDDEMQPDVRNILAMDL